MVLPVRRRLAGLLAASLTLAGCGAGGTPSAAPTSSPDDSAPEVTASAAPPAMVQAPGTVLTSSSGDGSVTALAAQGGGFSLLQGRDDAGAIRWTLTPYDVAGNQLVSILGDSFSGECGAADVSPHGQRLIITAQLQTQPAQGVMAAQHSESLTAFDASTGEKVWANIVVPSQRAQLTCNSADGRLQGFSATLDGRWGALRVQAGDTLVASAIDLSSGQVLARPDLLGALGNWLVTGTRRHMYGVADPSALVVPPLWARLGAFSNAVIPMDMPSEAVTGRFPVDDAQNPPSTGLSSDGTVLFTRLAADGEGSRVTAYALPAVRRLWVQTTAGSSYLTILGSGGNTLVAEKTADDGSRTTVGLNAHTGAALWTLPQVDVCGLSSTQMLVSVNGQTAVIDLASGQQLSYSAPGTASSGSPAGQCPEMLPSGIGIDTPADRLVVTQLLTP